MRDKHSDFDYIDLRSLLQAILDKRGFILIAAGIIMSLAVIYAALKPVKYQASILLKIQHNQHDLPDNNSATPTSNHASHNMEEPLALLISLIKTEYILKPVVQNLGLDIELKALNKQSSNKTVQIKTLQLPVPEIKKPLQLVIDQQQFQLYDNKKSLLVSGPVNQLINKNNIKIFVKASVPAEKSQFIITKYPESAIIDSLRSQLNTTDLNSQSDNNSNQVAIIRLSMIGKEAGLLSKTLNEIVATMQSQNIKQKTLAAEHKLAFLRQQLPILNHSLQAAQAKLNQYMVKTGRIDTQLQTQNLLTHIAEIDKALENLRSKKLGLLQQYTMHHPLLITLKQTQTELSNKRAQLVKQLKTLPDLDQTNASLKQDVKVKNNLYMLLLNQIHQYQVLKTGIISDIEILSPVTRPEMLAPPKLLVIALASLFVGILLSSICIVLWKLLRRRIDSPSWTEKTWDVKNLTTIPYSRQQALNSNVNKPHMLTPLLAAQAPHDKAIEALCRLRTLIQLKTPDNKQTIIAMLGITKDSGKTFIAANLASLLARIDNKVLLIDADIRNGHLHRYFSQSVSPGLTDVINDHKLIKQAIVHTHITNLDFLPAGSLINSPTDMLTQEQFKQLLLKFKSTYQFIILNTTASLSSIDNILVSLLADINLLVIGSNKHKAAEINTAINNFKDAGVKLDGCIFNKSKFNKKLTWKNQIKRLKSPLNNITQIRPYK